MASRVADETINRSDGLLRRILLCIFSAYLRIMGLRPTSSKCLAEDPCRCSFRELHQSFYDLSQDELPIRLEEDFTHHNDTIAAEQWIDESFTEEHAICHVAYSGSLLVTNILETNCISDLKAR